MPSRQWQASAGARAAARINSMPTRPMTIAAAAPPVGGVALRPASHAVASKPANASADIAGSSNAHSHGSIASAGSQHATNDASTSTTPSPQSLARSFASMLSQVGFERRSYSILPPARPPSVLQIGLARHGVGPRRVSAGVAKRVRPALVPPETSDLADDRPGHRVCRGSPPPKGSLDGFGREHPGAVCHFPPISSRTASHEDSEVVPRSTAKLPTGPVPWC